MHSRLQHYLPAGLVGILATGGLMASDTSRLQAVLQKELDDFVRGSVAPGATLGVVLPGGEVLSLASGMADAEAKTAMKPNDRMFSGSVGKTYAAALILQLASEGRFTLEDPLSKYFGTELWFKRLPNASTIRIQHLLAHTSGIPEHVEKEGFWQAVEANPDRIWKPEELLAYILGEKPLFEAGRGYSYADTNYILLGMLVERVTKATYYGELRRRILSPLGLKDTIPSDRRDLPGLVSGYSKLPAFFRMPAKVVEKGRYCFNPQLEWTGGGLVCSAPDLARWAKKLYGGQVLPEAWLAQMVTPSGQQSGMKDGAEYGLGAIVWNSDFGVSYGHSGFVPGYNTVVEYIPSLRIAIALQCNADTAIRRADSSPHQALSRFIRVLLNELEASKKKDADAAWISR